MLYLVNSFLKNTAANIASISGLGYMSWLSINSVSIVIGPSILLTNSCFWY